MKKLFLLLITLTTLVFSAIDNCKTDVYFGNGILTEKGGAIDNALLLRKAIKQKFGLPYFNKHIGKVDYAYNSTLGRAHDMLEAYIQLDREAPDFFNSLRGFFNEFFSGGVIHKIEI